MFLQTAIVLLLKSPSHDRKLDKVCHLLKLQTVRKSRFYEAEIWGLVEGWEVIDGLEGRIGKKVLKVDVLRAESLN